MNQFIEIRNPEIKPPEITFSAGEPRVEMLRIAPDGFYVRGERLVQDYQEAATVYRAMIDWLRGQGMMP